MHLKYVLREISRIQECLVLVTCVAVYLTLKIPGPYFLLNYQVNANWHEGFNGIFYYYLPSLRVPVDVYGWYRSDLSPTCHQSDQTHHSWSRMLVGRMGLKSCSAVLAWQILDNWLDAVF